MPHLLRKLLRFDWILLALILTLCVASVFIIQSATYTSEEKHLRDAYLAQRNWIVVAVLAHFFFALIDYRLWVKWAIPLFTITTALLVIVLFMPARNNVHSWISVGGIGFQPGEFSKVTFILLMAWFFAWRAQYAPNVVSAILALLLTAIPLGLILKQPDIGSAGVFVPIAALMMYAAGVRLWILGIPVSLGIIGYGYVYYGVFQRGWGVPGLKDYQLERILVWFDPNRDPQGAGWTLNQCLIAIGSGGLEGKGLGEGDQNILGFLPMDVANSDLVFAVFGEEFGFRGGASLLCMLGLIMISCLYVAMRARDRTGATVVCGVVGMIFAHAFVNIGMTIGVVPITGIPLPFISYGGSFLVATLSALGLVQSVWIHRKDFEEESQNARPYTSY